MKIFKFLLAIVALIVSSCANDLQDSLLEQESPNSPIALYRTQNEAINLAMESMSDFYPDKSRAALMVDYSHVIAVSARQSRSVEDAPSYYVVNFADNQGFALIAADRTREPLIAVSDNGNIHDVDNVDNPGLQMYLDLARISYLPGISLPDSLLVRDDSVFPGPGTPDPGLLEVRQETTIDTIYYQAPKIPVFWHQRFPANYYAPNSVAGCVPIAMAQTLAYCQYPPTLDLTFPNKPVSTITLNWPALIAQNFGYLYESTIEDKPHVYLELACLARELGHRINASYNPSSTGAYLDDARTTMHQILNGHGFAVSNIYNMEPIATSIGNGVYILGGSGTRPLYNGESQSLNHCWIMDGALIRRTNVKTWTRHTRLFEDWNLIQDDTTESTYAHLNWGYHESVYSNTETGRGYVGNGWYVEHVFYVQNDTYNYIAKYFKVYSTTSL